MKTTKVKFNIKDESLALFLQENLTNISKDHRIFQDGLLGTVTPQHMMRDELYFKKEKFDIGDLIILELSDRSQIRGTELINKYTYEAQEYDSVSVKMKLINFKVNIK